MNLHQVLAILRLRWWLVLLLLVLTIGAAAGITNYLPKRYSADTTLIVDVRADPLLATFAPAFASPAHMATQVEIIKSDRVAQRVVKILGLAQSQDAVAQWREETQGRIPMEAFFGNFLQRSIAVEAGRGSNIITLQFSSASPQFAVGAVNAFARTYLELSTEMRVEPARQSSSFFDERAKTLRADFEAAQARLTAFERSKGIAVSADRVDLEVDKLNSLTGQLSSAQVEFAEANSRRANAGTETSVDVQQSGAVQGLKSELARVETKLSEVSNVVGSNHPTRIALETQAAQIRQQITMEMRRVSGTTATASRISGQKIAELRAMADAQKRLVLSLRAERDEAAIMRKDVETAQRAYEAVASRRSQVSLESMVDQAGARVLSPGIEPITPSSPNMRKNVMGGAAAGLLLGLAAAFGLELLDRRVRGVADLSSIDGIPVLAVLSPKVGKPEPHRTTLALTAEHRPRLTMSRGAG